MTRHGLAGTHLVQALQRAGHTVGMTGDGVNDGPALRQADVGIAVARATDVTKAAASLVLTRPGLAEIIAAVDGSRRIYQRMRNFTLAMISRKMSTPTFCALWVIFAGALVVSPVHMVLLMLVGDISMMSVSTDRVAPSDKPDRWDVGPLSITGLSLAALLIALNSLEFWAASNLFHPGPAEAQTPVFVWLVFAGSQGVLFLTRGRGYVWSRPFPGRWGSSLDCPCVRPCDDSCNSRLADGADLTVTGSRVADPDGRFSDCRQYS